MRVDPASQDYAAPVAALFGDLAGQPLAMPDLEKRLNRYYGQGLLESLDYRFEPEDAGSATSRFGLTLSARRNSWGPNYVRFGLRLQDDFAGNSSFDAAVRLTFTELTEAGAEWIWDAQVGGTPRIATELYLPLSLRQRWFVAPHATLQIRNLPQVEDERQVGSLRVRSSRFGFDVGRLVGNQAELRGGFEREIGSSRVRLGDTTEPEVQFRTREYFARYSLDRLDNVAFPRHGDALRLEWRGQLEDAPQERISDSLRVDWRLARSWGRNTAVVWATAGTLLDPEATDERSHFPLGGFLNLSGLPNDVLSGPNLGIARLIYFRKVGSGGEGFLNVPLYAGFSLEAGNVWQASSDMSFGSARKDVSVFFGLDTFLGPAYLSAGYDNLGRSAFYLSLGRGF